MEEQLNIFDFITDGGQEAHQVISIQKPIRLIEFFAGYGSQAMALRNIGADFEHWFVCEFDKYAIKSYNAIHNTEYPTIDIRNVKGSDLDIKDSATFMYFLTYSFPCTDLSVAGKQLGMSKGGGTRSGLLWEVERILQEIVDSNGELPQLLMMENVPQVHGKKFKADFDDWCKFLENIGYVNFWQDLNAKNYGVAQNRNRTFMFSFLKTEFGNNPQYKFPEPVPLEKRLKDYLEDEVDEKYYINNEKAQKLIDTLIMNGTLEKYGNSSSRYEPQDGDTCYPLSSQDFVRTGFQNDVSFTLSARDYKDPKCVVENRGGKNSEETFGTITTDGSSPKHNNRVLIKQATKQGYIECEVGGVFDGSYPDSETRRGRVQENGNISPALTADGSEKLYRVEKDIDNPLKGKTDYGWHFEQNVYSENSNCSRSIKAAEGSGNIPKLIQRYRIRKLTPRECGRLMGVSDEDITKMLEVNSNSQCYKQFGNSIVVPVMEMMFRNLNIKGVSNE